MDTKRLLSSGYFPPELPPPFQTTNFSDKYDEIEIAWAARVAVIEALPNPPAGNPHPKTLLRRKMKESRWVPYSVPRFGLIRRNLAIPNPYHQAILSQSISDNWQDICDVYDRSQIGSTKPIENVGSNRAVDRKDSYSKFLEDCIIGAYSSRYELRTDISRFYPSLYTHVIPWAMHTKAIAKAEQGNLALVGNQLDTYVRNGNSRQTFGIPIGPDTSLILSEIVTCTIDEEIQSSMISSNVKAYRYMDDYRIFCKTRGEAESLLNNLQKLLNDYELHVNETKTEILESPYAIVDDWVSILQGFDLSINPGAPRPGQLSKQRRLLKDFASAALNFAQKYPDSWVVSYAFPFVTDIAIYDANWNLYLSLLFKLALVEPRVLSELTSILVLHKARVNKTLIKDFCNTVLEHHLPKGHHAECSWALWLCKEFKLRLRDSLAEAIFGSGDCISTLIALDLKASGLISSKVSTTGLEREMNADSLMGERWLLTYEAMTKGWVKVPRINPVNSNEYFKILKRKKVTFYDQNQTIKIRSIKMQKTDIIHVTPPKDGASYI